MEKTITITTRDGQASVAFSDAVQFEEFINAVMAVMTAMAKQCVTNGAPERAVFDLCNERFARMLELTFPEIEAHPEIEEIATMRAQDELVAAAVRETTNREQRRAFAKKIKARQAELKKDIKSDEDSDT